MLNYSVIEENPQRSSKKVVGILIGGMVVLLSAAVIMIGLFVLAKTNKDEAASNRDTCVTNTTGLQKIYNELNPVYTQKAATNKDLTQKVIEQRQKYAALSAQSQTLQKQLTDAQDHLTVVQNQLGTCIALGCVSLASNIYLFPRMSQWPELIKKLREESAYLLPRYLKTIPAHVSHLMYPREKVGVQYRTNLLYNSSGKLTKEAFATAVAGHRNTVTLIQTKAEEMIGFSLSLPWTMDQSITDPASWTYSFRNFVRTRKVDATRSVNGEGFLWIGDNDIRVAVGGDGSAVVGNSFAPIEQQQDPTNFYVAGGSFTVQNVVVYEFILSQ